VKYPFLILLAALLFAGCASTEGLTKSDEQTTREVLDHHWNTFQGNDLEGVMADYTEASILITPNRTYKGMQEIRDNFVSAFATFPNSATTMQLNKSIVQRDVGYILWEATGPKIRLSYGSDTFVIKDGKIISQTYAGVSTPR
jgi:hypothetical protein